MTMKNTVFITIDAWRADFADARFGHDLVPALAPYADHTTRYTHAYATSPWTSPSIVSMMTGERSIDHDVHYAWSTPNPRQTPIAERARARGMVVPNLTYLTVAENYHQLGWSPNDAPTDADPERLIRALRETPEPFFLWFHFKYTHLPYWPDERYRALFGVADGAVPDRVRDTVGSCFVLERHTHRLDPRDRDVVQRLYAANVRAMSDWLARVFGAAEERGLMGRTRFVLTSDHGEELLERDHVGHASTAEHARLHEELLRIPLFVIDPGTRAPCTLETPVQTDGLYALLADFVAPGAVAPSTLSSLYHGHPPPADPSPFVFHSARGGYRTPRAFEGQTVSAAIRGKHKVVVERFGAERVEAFDLEADPGETLGVEPNPELLAWLRAQIEGAGR